jgi:hypothetical protein
LDWAERVKLQAQAETVTTAEILPYSAQPQSAVAVVVATLQAAAAVLVAVAVHQTHRVPRRL